MRNSMAKKPTNCIAFRQTKRQRALCFSVAQNENPNTDKETKTIAGTVFMFAGLASSASGEDNSASLEQFVWVCFGFPMLPVTFMRALQWNRPMRSLWMFVGGFVGFGVTDFGIVDAVFHSLFPFCFICIVLASSRIGIVSENA